MLGLRDVLEDLTAASRALEDEIYGLRVTGRFPIKDQGVVFDLVCDPPPELQSLNYGPERVRISVLRDGRVLAFPQGPPRTWKHRQPSPMGPAMGKLAGELCLFYPHDPPELRWDWSRGFVAYLSLTQRHLFFEEFNRREGRWPVEDAPHGHPNQGSHPVATRQMKEAARRWST